MNLPRKDTEMSTLIGLAAVDWSYRCKYLKDLESSRRRSLEDWEIELKNWDPDNDDTKPSGHALASLREHLRHLR